MRALGLPNTKHFHEITKIADALAREFHPVLCLELSWLTAISTDSGRTSKEGRPAGTESGRTNGGIRGCGGKCVGQLAQLAPSTLTSFLLLRYDKKTYEDLKRQGLI